MGLRGASWEFFAFYLYLVLFETENFERSTKLERCNSRHGINSSTLSRITIAGCLFFVG